MKLAIVLLAACGGGVHGSPGDPIDWSQPSVSLTAGAMTMIVDGVAFHGTTDQLEIKHSSAGDELDVTWAEAGYMPRIHIEFFADGAGWSIGSAGDGVRIQRLDRSDWIQQAGRSYTTPAGQVYEGNLDFTIDDNGHHAELHFIDARLATLGVQ